MFLVLVEPWISGAKVDSRNLGFQYQIHEDPIGFSRGIWVLWSNPSITVSTLFQSRQLIHLDIKWNDFHGILSTIYESPNITTRKELGHDLRLLALSAVNLP